MRAIINRIDLYILPHIWGRPPFQPPILQHKVQKITTSKKCVCVCVCFNARKPSSIYINLLFARGAYFNKENMLLIVLRNENDEAELKRSHQQKKKCNWYSLTLNV